MPRSGTVLIVKPYTASFFGDNNCRQQSSTSQGVTTWWKSCTPDIRISGISVGYQRYNKQISRENRPNFNYISDRLQQTLKNISWIYLNISQISVDSGQRVKNLKNSWKQPSFDRIQQQNIKDVNWISRPFVYQISRVVTPSHQFWEVKAG